MTTTNNYYQLYREQTTQLVRSLVIKSGYIADELNKQVAYYQGSDAVGLDPKTWKYYKHLAGEYHFTDTEMFVISMDTLERIKFSKESLAIHRATARAYALGSRYYLELIAAYPSQELLINGILNPTDKDLAINAIDGTILNYQKSLIQPNEYSLLEQIQDWIYNFRDRWVNDAYVMTDELYSVTMMGITAILLVPAILVMRQNATNTNEVHAFHVRQYLASHGMLDSYINQLTLRQSLWLYRNIRYIDRTAGKDETFRWLIQNILSARSIPLSEYTLRHDIEDQLETLVPKLQFRRAELNDGFSQQAYDVITLDEALQKEDPLAPDNKDVRLFESDTMARAMVNSPSGLVQTKMLESSMMDYSDSSPYPFEDVLLAQWLHSAAKGYYTSVIGFNNPTTGERIPLSVKDAWTFMWYCMCRSVGMDITEVPAMYAQRVAREPLPTVDELMSVASSKRVGRDVAKAMLDLVPPTFPVVSTDAFYEQCVGIHTAQQKQRAYAANHEHSYARAMVQNMAALIYSDNIYRLEPEGTKYDTWLADKNLVVDKWLPDHFKEAHIALMRDATGLSLTTTSSLANIQRAMVGLLQQLSSYSIQVAREINETSIRQADMPALRFGDYNALGKAYVRLNLLRIQPIRSYTRQKHKSYWDIGRTLIDSNNSMRGKHRSNWALGPLLNAATTIPRYTIEGRLVTVGYKPVVKIPQNDEHIVPIPGVPEFLELPWQERHKFKDIYGNYWGPTAVPPRKLSTVIYRPFLFGLMFRQMATGKNPLSSLIRYTDMDGFASVNEPEVPQE